MSQPKPFHRAYRKCVDGPNSGYNSWAYVIDREYSQAPEHYVRAFLLIQKDLQLIFEFIEPSDGNLQTHSYRIHELFMRTCIEVEANFKAILKENIFNPRDKEGKSRLEKKWNIHDYRKVATTHHLSSYQVHLPIWDGTCGVFKPFAGWSATSELMWYQSYNKSKHDRHVQFREANLQNLLLSVSGLLALLSSQFGTQDFAPGHTLLATSGGGYYSTSPALGDFFHIDFPDDWTDEEKYEFDWETLKTQPHRFAQIDYDHI